MARTAPITVTSRARADAKTPKARSPPAGSKVTVGGGDGVPVTVEATTGPGDVIITTVPDASYPQETTP